MKLKSKLLIWTLFLFFIPIFIFIILFNVQYKLNYGIRSEENRKYLDYIYDNEIKKIDKHIDIIVNLIKTDQNQENIDKYLSLIKELNSEYADVFIIDYLDENNRYKELFKVIEVEKLDEVSLYISNSYVGRISNENVVTFLKKVDNNSFNSKIIGITVLQKNLNNFGFSNSSRYYLIKSNGEIIATNSFIIGNSFYNIYRISKEDISNEVEGNFKGSLNNKGIKFTYQALEDKKVYLVIQESNRAYNERIIDNFIIPTLVYAVIPLLLFGVFLFVFHKSTISLITKLREILNKVIGLDKDLDLIREDDSLFLIEQKLEKFSNRTQIKNKILIKNINNILDKGTELSENQEQNYKILDKEQNKMIYIKDEVSKIISLSEVNSLELEKLIKECGHIVKENKNITLMTESLRRSFHKLSDSSVNIEEMIENINLISDRTNLLSLNAKKEAERVTEYGESYSIIAEEIRNLSILILETSDKAREISHNVVERLSKSNQVMDLTINKINKLQDEIKKVDNNVKLLYENVNLENIEEKELNSMFKELEILILSGREKLINNINLINELNIIFQDIKKNNSSLKE